jgi:hypothetical protein
VRNCSPLEGMLDMASKPPGCSQAWHMAGSGALGKGV